LNSESRTSDTNTMDLSIVIPLYNEVESLRELHGEICRACEGMRSSFEVIYVDDASTDGSFGVLEAIHTEDPRARVIQFRRNCGKSEALAAGFAVVRGKMVVTMDADLQDDPAEIPNLVKKMEEGFDLVSGWKKHRRDPLSKRFPSRVWNRMTAMMTRVKIHDFNCGLKIYRCEVVETLDVYGEMHRYMPALAQWAGFQVGEIPVNHRPRKFGKTKFGSSRFIKGILDLITVVFLSRYVRRPLHIFGIVGLLSCLTGGAITGYLVVLRILKVSYLSNRPLLFVGVLLLIVGVQFISLGLLGEMITRSQAKTHNYAIRRTLGD